MMTRSLLVVLLIQFTVVSSLDAQVPVVSKKITSSIQGNGVGSVKIRPTHLRISIPIKVSEDVAEDATERLRELREEIVDRALGLGAIEDSIQAVAFQCTEMSSTTDPFGRRNAAEATPKFTAQCHLVADFELADLSDHEAMLAMSSTIVGELSSMVPQEQSSRRNYSFTTLPNGITTQQLQAPLGMFWAKVSAEQRAEACKMSLSQANTEVDSILEAMGMTATNRAVNQNPIYSSYSLRANHPVAEVLFSSGENLAISLFPDAVAYKVKLSVTAQFDAGLSKANADQNSK